jgi:hypothetical protein
VGAGLVIGLGHEKGHGKKNVLRTFEHLLRLSLRGHLALDLLPDLDTKMQMFLSSFESFQSTGHRQMSQEQYGQTSYDFFYIYTSDGETWTLSFVVDAKEGDCFHTLWERVWS